MEHCCQDMKINIEDNRLIHYSDVFDEYGINVMEDACSCVLIDYCPWCGRKLPASTRQKWFNELEKLGFENPLFDENIPDIYKCRKWRTKKNES